MASNREMLEGLLRHGKLTAQEREAFESMWDQIHRTGGKLSNKQRAWVEKVFYKQQLDRPQERSAKQATPKVGYVYDPNAKRTVAAFNLKQFETICPQIEKGSSTYERVKRFFEAGGQRFELRAGQKPVKPS